MSTPKYDLLIRNGTVVDGTGGPRRQADVAIAGERIAAVGDADGEAAREIDATGLIVAPGFVDVHSHDDVALMANPGLDFKAAQGVTTVVCGNCGAGVAPVNERMQAYYKLGVEGILGPVQEFAWRTIGEFYDAVRAAKPSVNAAFLVPHNPVRVAAMGTERRAPTEAELEQMKEYVAEGMESGAVGFSTGLIYRPGAYAQTEELIELAKVAARYGGIYASHIRGEGAELMDAVAEALRIGEEAGLPVQISHHKAAGRENWGRTRESLALIDEKRAGGLDVTIDVYPYVASSTALAAYVYRGRLMPQVDPHDLMIAGVKHQHEYEGKRLDEVAATMDLPPDEAAARLLQEEDNAVVIVHFSMEEGDVRRVLQHETCMVGSDGLPSPGGKPHPRLYGTFARVLGHYVRDEGVCALENVVQRMSALPAGKFRLADRGELRRGAWADIVVFDLERIDDVATYEDPRRYPSGVSYVFVNGSAVVEAGAPKNTGRGRVLARA
jgi:N-acyl-D-amino-acid deacylase